jgi:hypothetical protein
MLRYRFYDPSQLRRHLHEVDNAGLLFLRDHRKHVHYERVLLELEVRQTQARAVVRGEVVARADGRIQGTWVRIAQPQVVKRLCEQDSFVPRRQLRVSADQMVRLRLASGEQVVAQLLDIGQGGLRVHGAQALAMGESCDVRLIGAPVVTSDVGRAQVVRIEGNDAGLRFTLPENTVVTRLVHALQRAWTLALELDHLPECCQASGPLEPAMPDLRRAQLAIAR